jgi:hypothetical protein
MARAFALRFDTAAPLTASEYFNFGKVSRMVRRFAARKPGSTDVMFTKL